MAIPPHFFRLETEGLSSTTGIVPSGKPTLSSPQSKSSVFSRIFGWNKVRGVPGQELTSADRLAAEASPIKSRVLFINDVLRTQEYASYIEKKYHTDPYHSNVVCTSKYTLVNFLPKSLFEQFRRIANFYFLIISLLQLCTNLSPTNEYSTIGPLAIVLFATMVKEAMEDRLRHQQDYAVNHQKVEALGATSENQTADQSSNKVSQDPVPLGSGSGGSHSQSFQPVFWKNLRVGHVVKIHDKEQIPADVVLLFSSHEDGEAMCETSSLDGESNLKVRHCLKWAWGDCPYFKRQRRSGSDQVHLHGQDRYPDQDQMLFKVCSIGGIIYDGSNMNLRRIVTPTGAEGRK